MSYGFRIPPSDGRNKGEKAGGGERIEGLRPCQWKTGWSPWWRGPPSRLRCSHREAFRALGAATANFFPFLGGEVFYNCNRRFAILVPLCS